MTGRAREPAPPAGGGPSRFIERLRTSISKCLGWRLVLYLTGSLLILLGVSGWLALKLHREHLYELREQTAMGMGETILNSTHYSMLENDSEQLEQILANIGRRTNVLALRLIDARGNVRYSKDPAEVGLHSDITAPACQGCHQGGAMQAPAGLEDGLRLYSLPSGEDALGLAVPVLNSAECANASCHVHPMGQRVLGMLDLELSTLDLEQAMDAARAQMALLALLTMLGSSAVIGVLAWRVVHLPLHRVLDGIHRLGRGELSHRLPQAGA
jgi:two-component system NtrC family sensor kinase